MTEQRRASFRGKNLLGCPSIGRIHDLQFTHSHPRTAAATGLTIDTNTPQPVNPQLSPAVTPTGSQGTPRSWFGTSSGLTDPRSWLQSPRKWANNRTPTNQGGNSTPNTRKLVAYFNTLHKPKVEEFLNECDDEGNGRPSCSTSKKDSATATATASPIPSTLANIMHQTDKDGKSQHVAAQLPSSCQESEHQEVEPAPETSFFSRVVGRMARLNFSDGHDLEVRASTAPSSTLMKNGGHRRQVSPKPVKMSGPKGQSQSPDLLGEVHAADRGKKCLVLDLDETLIHSSFQPVEDADFVIPIVIEGSQYQVYVLKRPGVDGFLERVGRDYEVVIFTASLSLYADPLLDELDVHKVIRHRLYRESCTFFQGSYVKDMRRLGRDISQVILVDNSPLSYMFQPENAIGCSSYIDATSDVELGVIAAFLEDVKECEDVREHCRKWRKWGEYQNKAHTRLQLQGVHAG